MIRFAFAFLSIMALVTAPFPALAVTHTVDQIGFTFVPETLIIAPGDTVEWVWTGGIHTVTNGAHPDSSDTGTLFDAPLDGANPLFSFTFTSEGDVPYFCRPHFIFDMIGVIRVDAASAVLEPTQVLTWSRVKGLYR